MSIPRIPGYTKDDRPHSLAREWQQPEAEFPDELWPVDVLGVIQPSPSEWITVAEHYFHASEHGGKGSVLVPSDDVPGVLAQNTWFGRGVGNVGVWDDGRFEDGLRTTERGITAEFLCQVRRHHGFREPSVEVSLPFLWYWDAIRDGDIWFYLNEAGRDQPLIRSAVEEDSYRVEVRAVELRQYLSACHRSLVAQIDHVSKVSVERFGRVDAEYKDEWCNFTWIAEWDPVMGERPGFSRLLGQYVVEAMTGSRVPHWEERRAGSGYPEFIYGIDKANLEPIRHSCDPDILGTYFDPDDSLLHYLTPINFTPDVLDRYVNEPSRYHVTASRLTCLDLWGIAISTNTAGLIEVYLGDLGRDLPADEWSHWLGHNVPPEGAMSEDRFRRDFLNQPTPVQDLPRSLLQAREAAAAASRQLLGAPIWRNLKEPERTEFERLHRPVSSEPRSLGAPVLTMTKALIDAIDPDPIRSFLEVDTSDMRQLQLLDALVAEIGGDGEIAQVFRNLYRLRSSGGIAHLSGRDRGKAYAKFGIEGMPPAEAFDSICLQLIDALQTFVELVKGHR